MEDQVHLELGQDALEQARVEDRPEELALDERRDSVESSGARSSVTMGRPVAGEARDQAVADLAAGAR